MEVSVRDIPWDTALVALAGVYVAGVVVCLLLENRSPQSTFAGLFLFKVLPLLGLLVYGMFGRSWKAFSRCRELLSLLRGTSFADWAARVMVERQPSEIERLTGRGLDDQRLAQMLWASGRAPLTLVNRVEILRNATEKYPRLLADIEEALQAGSVLSSRCPPQLTGGDD